MSLPTIDQMVNEISDRLGTRSELTGNEAYLTPWAAPTGRIERAINDAFMEVLSTHKIRLWESQDNWYFSSLVYSTGTGSASANGTTVTGVGTLWAFDTEKPGTSVTATPGAAGNVANGTYSYKVTFLTPYGETEAGPVSATMTVSAGPKTVALTNIPIGGPFVTKRRIYRTMANKHFDGPWFLQQEIADNTTTTGTDNSDDASLNSLLSPPLENGSNNTGREWLFKFDSESTWHEIIEVTSGTTMTVSPRFPSDIPAGSTYAIVKNKWQMPIAGGGDPTDVFCILDMRDVEQQRRIEASDFRLMDRTFLTTGPPTNYARVKNNIVLWPAPDANGIYFKMRFYTRPPYRQVGHTPAHTLYPLPEEWNSIVVDIATGRCLLHQMETERAQVYFQRAKQQADSIMSIYAEEAEDYRVQMKPNPLFMSNRG